jgi:uncharacterized protein YggE
MARASRVMTPTGPASATAAAADGVLSDYAAAIDRFTTAALSLQPKTRWRKGETQRTGWQALRLSVLEISDTSQVGELLSALAAAGANISGLSWSVAAANESYDLARQQAGADARARAEQYAQALGVGLGPVAWAAEPGLRSTGHADWMSAAPGARALSAGAATEQPSASTCGTRSRLTSGSILFDAEPTRSRTASWPWYSAKKADF